MKSLLERLPHLLMETTEKTLVKQEAAVLNEQRRAKHRDNRQVSSSRGRDMSQTKSMLGGQSQMTAQVSSRKRRNLLNADDAETES